MKKQLLFGLTLLFLLFNSLAQAQKIKLKSGDAKVLDDQKLINIEFTYDKDLKIGKLSEADYIKKRKEEAGKKDPAKGDEWENKWKEERSSTYEPKFIKLFTEHSDLTESPSAKYTIIFNTTFIEPGFNVGVASKPAYINGVAFIVETKNKNNIIAEISIDNAKGIMPMGTDFASSWRIGESYARAGRELARFLK